MTALHRRLSKLEARRSTKGPAQFVDANDLDPEVLAIWLSVGIDRMTLVQLDALEENLRRLPV